MPDLIDLVSDTATMPTPEMRRAMADAAVGDEQRGEDPTVNELQKFAAHLLGKEAGLFLPSASMANQIAIRTQTQPGDEVICHEAAHIRLYEGGGPALLSGCLLAPLIADRGVFTPEQVRETIRPDSPYFPRTRLVAIENTNNRMGGCVWTQEEIAAVATVAREHKLLLHLDGARLMNAVVKQGVPASEIAAPFDTVTLCLSKGLGAPVGAILAGTQETINAARRWKHVFGGAMRQAGIIAAAGLYALHHNIDRLAEDHENAARLAEGLATIPGIRLDPPPETNIVFFDVAGTGLTPDEVTDRLNAVGVRVSYMNGTRLRFVTHLDISRAQIDEALERIRATLCP